MTLNEDDSSSFSLVADSVETLLSPFAELLLTSRLLVLVSGKDWNETFRLVCSCSLYFAFFARRSVIIDLGEGPKIGVRVIVLGGGQQIQSLDKSCDDVYSCNLAHLAGVESLLVLSPLLARNTGASRCRIKMTA